MYFFDRNKAFSERPACADDSGKACTYQQLWDRGDELIGKVSRRSLVLLVCTNDMQSLCAYLALLRKSCPVILMGQKSEELSVEKMISNYKPNFVLGPKEVIEKLEGIEDPVTELDEYLVCPLKSFGPAEGQAEERQEEIFPDLGLLLSTSGSTGEQKLVRLSYDNLQSNCDSIVEYLGLTENERPLTTLPMEYTYGLSVIHSHLAVGVEVILTNKTFFQPDFWELMEKKKITSIAGVPYSYEMLDRLHIEKMELPDLNTLTQAGGHLKEGLHEKFGKWATETGRRFFVMYGQTEATARMSYIPPEYCLDKIGSIGLPVPGGRIEIFDEENNPITQAGLKGELIYYGPNVSLGYAMCRDDLAKGDENRGRLETGDIAYMDGDGYYYISGRKKRFVKLYGKRMSLDQVQETLQEAFETGDILCTGDDETGIIVWAAASVKIDELYRIFLEKWGIRRDKISLETIDEIPRNSSGKILYKMLRRR